MGKRSGPTQASPALGTCPLGGTVEDVGCFALRGCPRHSEGHRAIFLRCDGIGSHRVNPARERDAGVPRPSVVTSDPPIHAELRNIANRGFTPKQVSAWQPAVEATVGECVDSMRTERRFDVVNRGSDWVPQTIDRNANQRDLVATLRFAKMALSSTSGGGFARWASNPASVARFLS